MPPPIQTNEHLLLLAPDSGIKTALEAEGFRVVTWPELQIGPLHNSTALHDAIENLFGYDWIIIANADAARFFLDRLKEHDVSDLDSLSVCAIAESTATALEEAHIHIDVVATRSYPSAIVEQLATYTGGSLDRLNFLLPQAAIGRDYLKGHIEIAGARADVVNIYQTVAPKDLIRLAGLHGQLLTGSVDAIGFASGNEVHEFARVFDTNDLIRLLKNTTVLSLDTDATRALAAFGITEPIELPEFSANAISDLLAKISR